MSHCGDGHAPEHTYFNVEYNTHVKSFRFMSNIGRNINKDFPGCLPLCTSCIIPDHHGLGDPNKKQIFHRMSRCSVRSFAFMSCSSSYFTADIPRLYFLCYCIEIRPTIAMS